MATVRRKFIKQLGITCTAGLVMGSFFSCSPVKYLYLSGDYTKLRVKKAELDPAGFVVIKHPDLQAPVYLAKQTGDDYTALLMLCTHKGCEVRPTGNYLLCPCHGSEFTRDGKVIKTPATQNLRTFPTETDNEYIYIRII